MTWLPPYLIALAAFWAFTKFGPWEWPVWTFTYRSGEGWTRTGRGFRRRGS